MQIIFKVTIAFPDVGGICGVSRSYLFNLRKDAEAFEKAVASRGDGVRVVGQSIDHIMADAGEAVREVDEEMDMVMRSAYSEAR